MMKTVFSAMRPTGKLHLGHLVGALENWVQLQETHNCIFSIVDWHAYMGEYEHSSAIKDNILEMALDWLAAGIDPDRSIMFVQSAVPEHLELQMIFAAMTPLGWLERNPTYKEQLREIKTRDLQTYAFLGYPVLQAADILLYRSQAVPIGEDQLPHLELTREIGRRFNHIYKTDYFEECKAILTETPRLLGIDGRKMSKSYQNAINLSDEEDVILKKTRQMVTDPQRVKLTDPGHPDDCSVFDYYKVFAPDQVNDVREWCTQATKGCNDCKKGLAKIMADKLANHRERRKELEKNLAEVHDILHDGAKKARAIAQQNLNEIKELIFSACPTSSN